MQITVTIANATPEEVAALFGGTLNTGMTSTRLNVAAHAQADEDKASEPVKPKATRASKKAEVPALSAEDAALQAEIAADMAEAAPEPAGARAVVDAGTGKPIEPVAEEDVNTPPAGDTVEMTFAEVKAKATKLAAADMNKLAEILGRYGAKKLSEVPEESLGDFAGDVIAALG